jgi:hypothetical protein
MSEFWSQREWLDWSNELAMILPEDAECWPGVNPEGAQVSIIKAALRYLVAEQAKMARVESLADEWDGAADHGDEEPNGRVIARTLRGCATDLRTALADTPAEEPAR